MADFPPEIPWIRSLDSAEKVEKFTSTSTTGMAREYVIVIKKLIEEVAIMGKNPEPKGIFRLSDCLNMTKTTRKNHGLQLMFKDWETFQSARHELDAYPEDWLWLHFDIVQGPNAVAPQVDPVALEKAAQGIPRRQRISLGWTTQSQGLFPVYRMEMLHRMNRFLYTSRNLFKRTVVLVINGHFMSTIPDVDKLISTFNAVTKYLVFYVDPEQEATVSKAKLRKIIEAAGPKVCYLDASEGFKTNYTFEAIDPPRPSRKPRGYNRAGGVQLAGPLFLLAVVLATRQ